MVNMCFAVQELPDLKLVREIVDVYVDLPDNSVIQFTHEGGNTEGESRFTHICGGGNVNVTQKWGLSLLAQAAEFTNMRSVVVTVKHYVTPDGGKVYVRSTNDTTVPYVVFTEDVSDLSVLGDGRWELYRNPDELSYLWAVCGYDSRLLYKIPFKSTIINHFVFTGSTVNEDRVKDFVKRKSYTACRPFVLANTRFAEAYSMAVVLINEVNVESIGRLFTCFAGKLFRLDEDSDMQLRLKACYKNKDVKVAASMIFDTVRSWDALGVYAMDIALFCVESLLVRNGMRLALPCMKYSANMDIKEFMVSIDS